MTPAAKGTTPDPLLGKLDEGFPESWIPKEEGDTIVGWVTRVERGYTTYGWRPILVLRDDEGELHSIWLLTEVLQNAMRRLRPVPGERIAIRFNGKKKAKNPRPGTSGEYNDFRVVVDRPEESAAIDWEATLGPTGDAAEQQQPPEDEIPF